MADYGFKEKDLERWIIKNWRQCARSVIQPFMPPSTTINYRLLGNQVPCPHGIIDILAYAQRTLFVIELKAVKTNEAVVEQVMRYCYDVEDAFNDCYFFRASDAGLGHLAAWPHIIEVLPVVVAPAFTTKAETTLSLIGCATLVNREDDRYHFGFPEFRHPTGGSLSNLLDPIACEVLGNDVGDQQLDAYKQALIFKCYRN